MPRHPRQQAPGRSPARLFCHCTRACMYGDIRHSPAEAGKSALRHTNLRRRGLHAWTSTHVPRRGYCTFHNTCSRAHVHRRTRSVHRPVQPRLRVVVGRHVHGALVALLRRGAGYCPRTGYVSMNTQHDHKQPHTSATARELPYHTTPGRYV